MMDTFMTIRRYGIILALVVWTASDAQARPDEVNEVVIVEGSGTHRILIHPAYVSVLYFPSRITHSVVSDPTRFIVQIDGSQVTMRPANGVPPNSVANVHVLTDTMKVTILLRTTPDVDQAVSQVVFQDADSVRTGPSLLDRVSLAISGIYGTAMVENATGGATADSTSTSSIFGAQAGVALAAGRYHSFELSMALAQVDTEFTELRQDKSVSLQTSSVVFLLTRLQLTTLLHFGERVMPKIRLGASVQSRDPVDTRTEYIRDGTGVVLLEGDEVRRYDVLMAGGAGIELPIHGRWRGGLEINAMRSMGNGESEFLSVECTAFVRWL